MSEKLTYEELEKRVRELEMALFKVKNKEAQSGENESSEANELAQRLISWEAHFSSIFNNKHVVMLIIDLNTGAIKDANPAAVKFYGWSYDELTGMNIKQINQLPPEEVQKEMHKAEQMNRNYFNFRHQLKNKTIRDVEVCSGPIKYGKETWLYSIVQDVTERKKADKEMSLTLKAISEGVWKWNFKTNEFEFSSVYYKMLGYEPDEFPANFESWKSLIHPDDYEAAFEIAMKYMRTKPDIYENFFRMKTKSGQYRWIHARGRVVERDVSGEAVRMIGNHIDITERKQNERKLRDIERRNQALLDYSPVCHKIVDLDFNLQYMSANGFKMLKLVHNDKVYGKPYPFDFFPAAFKKQMTQSLKKVRETGNTLTMEAQTNDVEGNEVWLDSVLVPVLDDDGKIDYITVVSADVTQRKLDEKEKEHLEKKLRQAQKMEAISTLAGGIAHDFNNLLGIITGNISYALNLVNQEEKLFDVLINVQEGAKQAHKLTQQLLTFAKGGEPIKKAVQLNQLVKESAEFMSRGTKSKCVFDLANDLWQVELDPGQFNQVMGNLITNANQAMPNGGTIFIRTENFYNQTDNYCSLPAGKYIKIAVEDKGDGILKKHLPKIFDPYFTTKQKGSGLGLSACFSIIKRHGGSITVYSEIEKGSVFSIYLPALIDEKNTVKIEKKTDQVHSVHRKILIMDDQEPILEMVGIMLEYMNYESQFAKDGAETIEKYREAYQSQNPFDLVILDLTIPGGMGGVETISELLKINPKVKAIVSSGYSNDPIMANYKDHGFCGVAPKPYTMEQLSDVLKDIFEENEYY